MKDILCECGHEAGEHIPTWKCLAMGCTCDRDCEDVLRAHIAKQDAVIEAEIFRLVEMQIALVRNNLPNLAELLSERFDALDSTKAG